MDNLEWATGFAEQFGLYHVNRTDPDLKRTPKASVKTYNQIIRCNGFPHPDSGHECLQPKPNVTVAPPADPSLNFLGLTLTPEQAEVGFHTTFALLMVSCVAALVAAVCFCRRKHRGKSF
ncbi:unnamed protein product [Knipowitschia caucasica]|uniref:Uncharacterized protein n=1 Tax=Knipowitschia caucasica TaxID=637954 RepID=A0AAV2JZX7_KNICA